MGHQHTVLLPRLLPTWEGRDKLYRIRIRRADAYPVFVRPHHPVIQYSRIRGAVDCRALPQCS
jgi:hypothetical protein